MKKMTDLNNEEQVLKAVSNDGWDLRYEKFVLTAVSNDGRVLKFASPKLQNNEKIVLAAVSNDGRALQYASPELQDNENLVLAAVSKFGDAFRFASSRLKNSRSFRSLIFNRNFDRIETRVIEKSKLYDFKFRFNKIQIQNFKDILMKIF